MRILHLLTQTELTGSEVYAQTLVRSQIDQGHQVWTVADQFHVPFKGETICLPLTFSKGLKKLKLILQLRNLILKNQIHVIHAHSRGATRVAYWASRWTRVPLVTTLHGRQHMSWSKKIFNQYGQIIIAICESLKNDLVTRFNYNAQKIVTLPNPVTESKNLKQNFEFSNPLKIIVAGRSTGPKGRRLQEFLEKVLWPLQKKYNFELHFVAGPLAKFNLEFQNQLKNKSSVNFVYTEHVQNLRQEIKKFDLVIGGGRIALEAILEKIPTFAIGEFCSHGFVTSSNLDSAIETNMGDIGPKLEIPLDIDLARHQIEDFILNPKPIEKTVFESVLTHFNEKKVMNDVLSIYQKVQLPEFWIPTLMYHKVPDSDIKTKHRIFITAKNFEKHMQWLKWLGFKTLSFSDLDKIKNGQMKLPKKPLMITFDDGYLDNLTHAGPLLKKYGHKAMLYILANHNLKINDWDQDGSESQDRLMTLNEKIQAQQFFEIGAHGFDHQNLQKISDEKALYEITESKIKLEKEFDTQITSFAYPFGRFSEKHSVMVQQAGYTSAVSTDHGSFSQFEDSFTIFRANIFPEDGIWALWKKTRPSYRQRFFKKHKK